MFQSIRIFHREININWYNSSVAVENLLSAFKNSFCDDADSQADNKMRATRRNISAAFKFVWTAREHQP